MRPLAASRFPFLGEPYTVSTFTRTAQRSGALRKLPDSLAHAKFIGVSTTACGEVCNTWTKFFDIPFAATDQEQCPRCDAALAAAPHGAVAASPGMNRGPVLLVYSPVGAGSRSCRSIPHLNLSSSSKIVTVTSPTREETK